MKKILLITLSVVFFILGLSIVVKSEKVKKLSCDSNGNFTILIVSDPQCGTPSQWKEARDELETLIKRADPDFVLINGDMNSYNKIPADMWKLFISPLEKEKIYWSTVNGNHDPFNNDYYKMYKSYEYCLNNIVSETDKNYEPGRPMNYVLPVYSNDGKKIVFAIYGMDSGTLNKKGYEGLTKNQIAWYNTQSQNFKLLNGGNAITSILCMHIPLPQTLEMYYGGGKVYGIANEINFNPNGYTTQGGKKIDKINVHTSDIEQDNNMLGEIFKNQDIKAVIFGHNHRNNFIGSYKGVLLGFAGKLSTGCYSDILCRGGRVIRFNESSPDKFTTEWLTSLKTGKDQPPIYSDGSVAK